MKKIFQAQPHHSQQKQLNFKLPQPIESNLLKRKYTRSISTFNNPKPNFQPTFIKSASQRKFTNINPKHDPLKNLQNIFIEHPKFTSEQQLLTNMAHKFQQSCSMAQQLKLHNLLISIKEYVGAIIANLLEIHSNTIKRLINKVQSLSYEYERVIDDCQKQAQQKVKKQAFSIEKQLGKKIQNSIVKSLFNNIILQEFSFGGINVEQRIRQSNIMENFVKQAEMNQFSEQEYESEGKEKSIDLRSLAEITKKIKLHTTEEFQQSMNI